MNPAICHSSRITVSVKDNSDFATPETVHVYTEKKWLEILMLDF